MCYNINANEPKEQQLQSYVYVHNNATNSAVAISLRIKTSYMWGLIKMFYTSSWCIKAFYISTVN